MKISRVKIFFLLLIIILLIFIIIKIVIHAKSGGYYNLKDPSAQIREIETPMKLWMNGYLAIFFRYKYFSFVNFLLFPLLIYFLLTIEKRKRWEISIFFVMILSIILIGAKGYGNPRYAFTLYPFSIAIITLIVCEIGGKYFPKHQYKVISTILFLSILSFVINWTMFKDHWDDAFRRGALFPFTQITDYLNKIEINETNCISVINVPAFFYYTDYKNNNFDFGKIKAKRLFKYLKKRNIKYILANTSEIQKLNVYRRLSEFIDRRAVMVTNAGNIGLFKILYDEEINKIPDYETDFSEWSETESIISDKNDLNKINPFLMRTGGSSLFKFSKETDKNFNKIKINLIEKIGRDPAIQFGYFLGEKGLKLKFKPGDSVTFIVRVRLSNIGKCRAFIYFQDYNNWIKEEIRCFSDEWINYFVSMTIPKDSTMIYAGILYESDYKEEYMEIMNPRIFIDRVD